MTDLLPYTATLDLIGPDTIDLLDRVITCSVGDLKTGETRPGALLTPQGKVITDFIVARTDQGCALAVHPDAIGTLEKRLKLFRLRADVEIVRGDDRDLETSEADRILAGRPAFGADFGEAEVFPTDINLDLFDGIAYQKGCFVGQEVVSRMKRRGKIRKRTVVLSGADVQSGADVRAGDRLLGQVKSASQTHALAVLRIDHLADALSQQSSLTAGDAGVEVLLPDWLSTSMEDAVRC